MKSMSEINNKLLERKEVIVEMEAGSTLSNSEVAAKLAEKYKVNQEVIAVKKVKGSFGSHNMTVEAFIYVSKEAKDLIEPKPKAKKAVPQ